LMNDSSLMKRAVHLSRRITTFDSIGQGYAVFFHTLRRVGSIQSPVTFSLWDPNILLSITLWNIRNQYPSLRVRDEFYADTKQ
jgi:hypothetical protein